MEGNPTPKAEKAKANSAESKNDQTKWESKEPLPQWTHYKEAVEAAKTTEGLVKAAKAKAASKEGPVMSDKEGGYPGRAEDSAIEAWEKHLDIKPTKKPEEKPIEEETESEDGVPMYYATKESGDSNKEENEAAKDPVINEEPEAVVVAPEKKEKVEAGIPNDSMLGPVIASQVPEEKVLGDAWTKAVKVENNSKNLDKFKAEWRETRDKANQLESEFKDKYEAHVLAESRKWTTLPRRMFGLQPKLTDELQKLKIESDGAQAQFQFAAKQLLTLQDSDTAARLSRRLLPKVAAMSPYVHQERWLAQERSVDQAWGESKYLRPTLETLKKHRYTLAAASVGVASFSSAGVIPVLTAMGAAVLAGGSMRELGNRFYVGWSRDGLEKARENIGNNYFEKSYADVNNEIERLTFRVGARKKHVQVASVVASVAAGVGAGMYASSYIRGLEDAPVAPPDTAAPVAPDAQPPVNADPQLPDQAPIPSHRPLEQMGDAKVLEAMQPQVEQGIQDINNGLKAGPPDITPDQVPVPEFHRPEAPDQAGAFQSTPGEAPIPEARPEEVIHKVVKGDNVWNAMEGKGPDANPIGGKSEVLSGMSPADRQAALDRLVEYGENHPDFAKEIGAIKSNGDIHRIYPGEEINITALDNKLRELLGIPDSTPAPVPEAVPNTPAPIEVSSIEPGSEAWVHGKTGEYVIEHVVEDMNDMTIGDARNLSMGLENNDPTAQEILGNMGWDQQSFNDVLNTIDKGANRNLTIGDYLNASKEATTPITAPEPSYDGYDPFDKSVKTHDVSSVAPEAPSQSLDSYVRGIEQSKGGMLESFFGLGEKSIAGTFDKIKDLTFSELVNAVKTGDAPVGVTDAGLDRWADEINQQLRLGVNFSDTETVGQFFNKVTSPGAQA